MSPGEESCTVAYVTNRDLVTCTPNPEELGLVTAASLERQQEFQLGREAARRAIARMRVQPGPVLRRGRIPVFPPGLVGSISHSNGTGVALVAAKGWARAVGVDVQSRERLLPLRAAAHVCRPEERAWVEAAPERLLPEIFSAKEAIYKALSVSTGQNVPFHRMSLRPKGNGFEGFLLPRPGGRLTTPSPSLAVEQLSDMHTIFSWAILVRDPAAWVGARDVVAGLLRGALGPEV